MHNKFIILFNDGKPYAVITGSYNYTQNARDNIENIVYIEDSAIAEEYSKEFERILKMSKPLRL